MLPMDSHVHSELSWDAVEGSMLGTCERAIAIGLPAIAFTDHADFTKWAYPGTAKDSAVVRVIGEHATSGILDSNGYWELLEKCRSQFPDLIVLSGVEAGEPHIFAEELSELLASRPVDRVLGSLHSVEVDGQLLYAPKLLKTSDPYDVLRTYFQEAVRLVESSAPFHVLTHIDYPVRAWPKHLRPFNAHEFEDEYRAVLRALANSGRALEVNTAGPWPAPNVLRWWYQEGGATVAFGSDAHEPRDIGKDFTTAAAMVEAVGFRPGPTPVDYWRR